MFYENSIIAGLDEAGRGPLAGPVVAACVALPPSFSSPLLADSKKLSEKKRREAEIFIKQNALSWATFSVSNKIIDEINILNATLLAFKKAYEICRANINVEKVIIDGIWKIDISEEIYAIPKADTIYPSVMAASILAKTRRDSLMATADRKWPEYGYKKHKGYPTKEHVGKIYRFGESPIQRKSFKVPNYP